MAEPRIIFAIIVGRGTPIFLKTVPGAAMHADAMPHLLAVFGTSSQGGGPGCSTDRHEKLVS